ncbi:uncharacterized protein [Apostichopus japonicus]|uniref:uncharacterized protein isoform X2 n=1 Tax=Stichopus japonicus TaxID=307972 RepID=UPI003AB279B5
MRDSIMKISRCVLIDFDFLSVTFFITLFYLTKAHGIERFAMVGSSTNLYCKLPNASDEVTIVWKFNKERISTSHFRKYSISNKTDFIERDGHIASVLKLTNLTFRDAGNYTCLIFLPTSGSLSTYYLLQVQSLPQITMLNSTRRKTKTFSASCCAEFALPLNQTMIEWSAEFTDEFIITSEFQEARRLESRNTKLCSNVNVKAEIVLRETNLTCVMKNTFNISANLNVHGFYLNTIEMITPPKVEVVKSGNTTITCQTGVEERREVILQWLNHTNWETVTVPSHRSPYRGDLFLWRFDIQTTVGGTYRCLLSRRDGETYSASDTAVVVVLTDSLNTLTVFVATSFGFVLCVVLTLLMCIIYKCSSKIHSKRQREKIITQTPIPMEALPTANHEVANSRNNYDDYDMNDESRNNDEDEEISTGDKLTLFKRTSRRGKRRERWIGQFKKGTKDEKIVHTFTCGAAASLVDNRVWWSYCSRILTLPAHSNIIRTIDVCKIQGVTYCIQEKLTFGSLRKRLEASRQNPLVSTELASYALNVISGVNFLHSNGWLHPGLSAGKILLTNSGKSCKLYDFCLATDAKAVMSSIVKGKNILPVSFATEAIFRKQYNEESDTWAVGVLLWELFSSGAKVPVYKTKQQKPTYEDILEMLPCPDDCPNNMTFHRHIRFVVLDILNPAWNQHKSTKRKSSVIEYTVPENWGASYIY